RPTKLASRLDGVARIAVLRANGIGDLIFALPALDALRAAYPTATITLLGLAHHAELLAGRPSPVDDVVVLPAGILDGDAGARAIRDRGHRVVVTGTGSEAGILTTVARLAASEVILAPDLSVPALVGLVAGADVVVANDSGPLHVAIALDTPTVGLFWFPNL